ncbi:MAG: hypothetical protein KDA42_15415 [Planctomycetales bacterium]|nr:hypothetical protein [Planctomycetales bacterium]
MPALSVILGGLGSRQQLTGQLSELQRSLRPTTPDYEVLLVGPHANSSLADNYESEHSKRLRFVAVDQPNASLADWVRRGLEASASDLVALVEFGNRAACRYIPPALARLARADFVQGKRRRQGLHKLSHRLARIPQWLVLGLDVHDPGCLFWAARREALAEVPLNNDVLRYLGPLVAENGYRVDEIAVPYAISADRSAEHFENPGNLLIAWREKLRLRIEQEELLDAQKDSTPPATIPFPTQQRKSA